MTAICIGCGCTDQHACFDVEKNAPCHWERIDYKAGLGVCSSCREIASAWDAGDREISEQAAANIPQTVSSQPVKESP